MHPKSLTTVSMKNLAKLRHDQDLCTQERASAPIAANCEHSVHVPFDISIRGGHKDGSAERCVQKVD